MDERSVIVNYIAQIWEGDSSSLLRVLYNFALEEQNSCGWRNSMIWRITKMHLRDDAPKVLFSYLQQVFPLTANTVVGLANAAAEIWSAAEWDVNTRDITIPVAQLLHYDTVLLAQSLEALPMCKKALLVDACEHYCNATTAVALLGTTGSSSYITKDSMKLCGSIFFAGVAAAAIGVAAGTTAPIGIAAFGAGNLVAGIGYSAFKWFKPKYDTWMKQDELDEACRTLGVARNSTRKEVDRAYKRKMMDCHPDKGGSAEAACRLSDSKKLLLEHMDEFSS